MVLSIRKSRPASKIATVSGTVDLVELLFSAVLMLVDFVSWFCEPQQRGEALGAAGVFSTFGFGRKSMLGIFFEPKAKRSIATRGKRPGSARAASGARRVEDLNGQGPREGRDGG